VLAAAAGALDFEVLGAVLGVEDPDEPDDPPESEVLAAGADFSEPASDPDPLDPDPLDPDEELFWASRLSVR
jgi:hypothetical protein